MSLRIQDRPAGWRLIVEVWVKTKRKCLYPPKERYPQYGLDPDDDYTTAIEKLKSIRAKNKLDKTAERRAKIEQRLNHEALQESAFLPRKLYADFLDWLKGRRLWDEIPDKAHSHLRAMRKCVLDVNLDPSEWTGQPEKIFRWFLREKLSLSYIEKILPLLNDYGYYYCREFRRPYLPIKPPRGDQARRIDDANLSERDGAREESRPLAESLLERLRGLHDDQMRWIRASFYLGLRPIETDNLTEENREKTWGIYTDEKGTPILKFYQTKLVKISRERRWKRIPAILLAQRNLLIELDHGMKVKRPLVKTIQLRLGPGYTTYMGRKGFEKLMRENGQDFVNISRWLGHRNLKQTESHYRETEAVEYEPA